MKKHFFSFILMAALFAAVVVSCDKDDDDDDYSLPTPLIGGLSGIIEGKPALRDSVGINFTKITNFLTLYDVDFRDFVETSQIINGKFIFSSLPTPPTKNLELFNQKNIKISNKNAKTCILNISSYTKYEEKYNRGERLYHINSPDTMVLYIYADQDVKIKGTFYDSDMEINNRTKINMNLIKGWNSILKINCGSDSQGFISEMKNGKPSLDAKWTADVL